MPAPQGFGIARRSLGCNSDGKVQPPREICSNLMAGEYKKEFFYVS